MKAAQINCTASGGSTGKIVGQLSRKLFENGIDNIILSSGYKEQKLSENTYFISGFRGVRLHQFLGWLFGDSGFHSYFRTLKAIRILKKYAPDIVHLHNLHGYYLHVPLLLKYLKRSGIPVIWTVHDCWMFTGHCTHYTRAGCRRWIEGCGNCPQRKQYPYSLVFDRSRRLWKVKKKLSEGWRNLHIVTVSDWLKKEVQQSFWKYPIHRLYNGIDLTCFSPLDTADARKMLGIAPDVFLILGVAATWNTRKGLDDFKTLAGMLNPDEKILLIGVTEKQKAELPDTIIGIPGISDAALLARYYNAADIFVSLSYEETMGLTVAEAMACGAPALVYDSTALPELVHDGCGAVVSCGDVSAAFRAVQNIKELTKNHFSAACRKAAADSFDQEKQLQDYCRLYKEISEGTVTDER